MSSRLSIILGLTATCLGHPANAEDWPQFGRDQTRNAVSPEKGPPGWWQFEERDDKGKLLTPSKNIHWSAELNGSIYSRLLGDPVVVDGLVWVGSPHWVNLGEERGVRCDAALVCLDEKSGKELYRHHSQRLDDGWQSGRWHGHGSSPYIEGSTLWFVTNRCEVVCLDIGPLKKNGAKPREFWKLDMRKELGVKSRAALFANRRCSVAAYKDWIYVITGNGEYPEDDKLVVAADAPSLICLEKKTGKVVWKDNSPGKNILFGQFASPTVIEVNGRVQVVAPQGDGWVRSFDPATGRLVWKFDTNPHDSNLELGTRIALSATAVFHGGRLYIGNGWDSESCVGPGWLYCIDPSKTGDISPQFTSGPDKGKPNPNSGMVWKYGGVVENTKPDKLGQRPLIFSRTISNVAVHRGLLIAVDGEGTIHCLDARTGARYWTHRTEGMGNYGSPLIVDDRVYVATFGDGICIFDLAKEKKLLAQIGKEFCSSCSPVFANGVLYVASETTLFAIAGKEPPPKR